MNPEKGSLLVLARRPRYNRCRIPGTGEVPDHSCQISRVDNHGYTYTCPCSTSNYLKSSY